MIKFFKNCMALILVVFTVSFSLHGMDVSDCEIVIKKPSNLYYGDTYILVCPGNQIGVQFQADQLWPELKSSECENLFVETICKTYLQSFDVDSSSLNILKNVIAMDQSFNVIDKVKNITPKQLKDVVTIVDTLQISCTINNYTIKDLIIGGKLISSAEFLFDVMKRSYEDLGKKEQLEYKLTETESIIKNNQFCEAIFPSLSMCNMRDTNNQINDLFKRYNFGYCYKQTFFLATSLKYCTSDQQNFVYDTFKDESGDSTKVNNIIQQFSDNLCSYNFEVWLKLLEKLAKNLIEQRLSRSACPTIFYPKDILKKYQKDMGLLSSDEYIIYNIKTGHLANIYYLESFVMKISNRDSCTQTAAEEDFKKSIIDLQKKHHLWLKEQDTIVNRIIPCQLSNKAIKVLGNILYQAQRSQEEKTNDDAWNKIMQSIATLSLEERTKMMKLFDELHIISYCFSKNNPMVDLKNLIDPSFKSELINQSVKNITEKQRLVDSPKISSNGRLWWQIVAALLAVGVFGYGYYKYYAQQQ